MKYVFALMLAVQAFAAPTDPRLIDRMWQRYVPTVHELLLGHLTHDDALRAAATEADHASVTLKLWLDRRGAVAHVDVMTPSDEPTFDRAVRTAAERIGVLPDLPPPLAEHGRRSGLSITFGR